MTVIWNNRSADTNGSICSTTARPASRLDPPRFSLGALEPDSTKRSGVHWVEEKLEVEEVMETPEVGPGDMLLMRDNTIHATQSKDGDSIDPAAARAEKLNSSVGQERSMPTPAATQATEDRRVAVALRTCDPETPIDWHRVTSSATPVRMLSFVDQSFWFSKLDFTAFRLTQETTSASLWGTWCRT